MASPTSRPASASVPIFPSLLMVIFHHKNPFGYYRPPSKWEVVSHCGSGLLRPDDSLSVFSGVGWLFVCLLVRNVCCPLPIVEGSWFGLLLSIGRVLVWEDVAG